MVKKYQLVTILVTGIVALIVGLSQPVTAQDDEIQKLRQKITELENRIKDLESLLIIYGEPGAIQNETDPGWQNKKNWRKLETGMTQDQVEAVLGEPIKKIEGVMTLWYYPNIYRGYVSFDEKGHLTRWHEP